MYLYVKSTSQESEWSIYLQIRSTEFACTKPGE